MRKTGRAATVAAGVVITVSLGIGPAFAEGSWSSSIGGWLTGKESRHWSDSNRDNVATTVKFSGCSASHGTFRYAGLQLKKERANLPDPVVARDNNYCDTSSFGDVSAGKYYFNYSNMNGYDQPFAALTVSSVVVKY
ncbi:hypothetical protein AB0J57_13070 [Streptomyces sp. NPDC049837]|uniref:hypothetical protein n=1 Tax=Streptomyces sp. NPDC049837 TaxID=3155277 RepID=UPI003449FBEB